MLMSRVLIAACLTAAAAPVLAEADWYGLVEKRPEQKVGTWVIGGKEVVVTEAVRLDEKEGPATVGACVKLDYETRNGVRYLDEIETEKDASKCARK